MTSSHLKNVMLFLGLALIFALVQVKLIYAFKPTLKDFAVTRTLQGTYVVGGGAGGTIASTTVNGESLFCSIDYLGPANSCPTHYAGREVSVKLATYQHASGTGSVVMQIVAANGARTDFTPEKRLHLWWFSSKGQAVLTTMICTFLVGAACQFLLNWWHKWQMPKKQ